MIGPNLEIYIEIIAEQILEISDTLLVTQDVTNILVGSVPTEVVNLVSYSSNP